jgi:ATP-dependent DNA helicase PIF1
MLATEPKANFATKQTRTFGQVDAFARSYADQVGDTETVKIANSDSLNDIEVTPEYRKIKSALMTPGKIVFVSGGAGTGKSTLIKWLSKEFMGEAVICAPSGVAALNIGGKTIHSLCHFPPTWVLPSDIKINSRSVVKYARLLIIDEISMVNANLLDAVDEYLKLNRKNQKPFGGISILMVGDLHQLPPVIDENRKKLFSAIYSSPKFFSAKSIQDCDFEYFELSQNFRQVDAEFVSLLNDIREGENLERSIAELNSKCQLLGSPEEGAVTLSPRNLEVDRINDLKLKNLTGNSQVFHGKIEGKFDSKRLPAPNRIELKVGAQVMLLKNDSDYVNGDTGIVTELNTHRVRVRLIRSGRVVQIPYATWEQFDFSYDRDSKKITRKVIGTYKQLPLTLAWAITIHKSQGLTIERVHLDLGRGAFDTGQTYVALSRCRSMKSLMLSRPLNSSDVKIDVQAKGFYSAVR